MREPVETRAVRTPRVRRMDHPDTSSVSAIVRSIVRPGMSDREKALAVYDFVRQAVYHWPAAREGDTPADFEYGVVYDPVKLVSVYGYGYCYQNRAALEALWQAAGLEARSAGIGGHSVAEVFYEGAWHYFDADQHGYCLLDDGTTVAAIEDLARRPDLLLAPRHRPNPFFPATAQPRIPYEALPILASYFATTGDNHYQHDKIVLGHTMDVTLLPGMRLTRRFAGDGRWNNWRQTLKSERDAGYIDPLAGPRDNLGGDGYGNGELLYQPDLTSGSAEYRAGVWTDENVAQTPSGLTPANGGREAASVFRIRLPYAIVGWPTSFSSNLPPVGAAVLGARCVRAGADARQALDVSVDGGRSWTNVWAAAGTGDDNVRVDASALVVPRYEYWLRLRQSALRPADARIERLSVRTAFQCAPRALPALRPGRNDLVFELGDETETLEWRADVRGGGALHEADRVDNLVLRDGGLVSTNDTAGSAVFAFDAPAGGAFVYADLHAGCRREPRQTPPEEFVGLSASTDGATWTPVWRDAYPGWAEHWSYHGNGRYDCPAGTRRLWVRVSVRTAVGAAVRDLRAALHWRPAGARGVPPRGVRVTHRWTADGRPAEFSRVCTAAPTRYAVEAAGAAVTNREVTIEPVRAPGLVWREDEPLVTPPPQPDPEVDLDNQRELRRLLAAIAADPEAGLAAAAAQTRFEWLAKSAREALNLRRRE